MINQIYSCWCCFYLNALSRLHRQGHDEEEEEKKRDEKNYEHAKTKIGKERRKKRNEDEFTVPIIFQENVIRTVAFEQLER